MTVPLDYQNSMVEHMQTDGQAVQTFELATGHYPNLTMTQDLVDVVKQVVAAQT